MTAFVVVPCFNEASRWNAKYWTDVTQIPDTRWVFVDDGSTDETLQLLEAFCSASSSHLISQHRNQGKAEAVRRGMIWSLDEALPGDTLAFIDADGAFKREDIECLLNLSRTKFIDDEWDAVWSSRVALAGRDIHRSSRRHYLGRVAATVLFGSEADVPYDTQSGLKAFRCSTDLKALLQRPFDTRWLFEIEMLLRFQADHQDHLRVWEEPLMHWSEVPGSKVAGRELFRAAREIARVKKMQRSLARQRHRQGSP